MESGNQCAGHCRRGEGTFDGVTAVHHGDRGRMTQ